MTELTAEECRRAEETEEEVTKAAASEAAASSMALATIGTQPPTAHQLVADQEVQRANDDARARKRLLRKAAVQPLLAIPTAAVDDIAGPGAPVGKTSSKKARRRWENKAKQRLAERRCAEKNHHCADEEFRRVLKACLLYTSPSPRDLSTSRMPSSA